MHNSYSGLLEGKTGEWSEGNSTWRRNLDSNRNSPTYNKNIRLKQQITKYEQDILQKQIPRSDGTMEDLVTCYNTQNVWYYICRACSTSGVVWNEFVHHLKSRRHEENLRKVYNRSHVFPRDESRHNDRSKRKPNEMRPVNDNPNAVCKIQTELNNYTEPLIGLEYLLEIIDKPNNYSYYCLLCDITLKGPLKTIASHMSIQTHWAKYLEKFFHTAAEKLDKIGFRENRHTRYKLYKHVVARIQHVFGRLKPIQVQRNIFENNRRNILDKIEKGKHFMETPGNTFVECVNISHLNSNRCNDAWTGRTSSPRRENNKNIKPLMSTVIEQPSHSSQGNWESQGSEAYHFDRKDSNKDLRNILDNNYSHNKKLITADHFKAADNERSRHFQQDQRNLLQDVEPPSLFARFEEEERRFYEYTCSNDGVNLWQNYQKRVQMIEENLLEELRYYRETPQKHPKYEEERNEYYEKRNEELISMGEDPRNYDIKVEWDAFWDIRLNGLFKEIFEKEKAQLRQQLQFLQIDSKVDDKRSFDNSKDYKISETPSFSFNSKPDAPEKYNELSHGREKQSSHIPVIPVLRQLSVLEQNLGSLGPKVVDLLSTALMLDKSSENGADAVMLSGENCILLETVREKLKGFCQSGLLPAAMVGITEASIRSIDELLDSVTKREKSLTPGYKVSYIDKQKSFSSDKRHRSSDRRPLSPNERKPHYNESRHRSNEKRFQSNDRSRSNEKRPRSSEKRPRTPEKRFRSTTNERQYRSNEQTRLTEKNPFEYAENKIERKLQTNQGPRYNDERIIYNKEVFTSDNNRYQSQNFLPPKTLSVSEINLYVEKLGILSDLTFIQRAAISQQIGSLLLVRGVVEITEDELLLLIKTLIPGSAASNLINNIPQSANFQFPNQYSSTNISGRTLPDKGLGILDTPSTNYLMNQRVKPSYGQSTSFLGAGNISMAMNASLLNKHAGSSDVTYPLNANPYTSSDRRKF